MFPAQRRRRGEREAAESCTASRVGAGDKNDANEPEVVVAAAPPPPAARAAEGLPRLPPPPPRASAAAGAPFVFYWSRPLGAPDSVYRLAVAESRRNSHGWAVPLSLPQLRQEIRNTAQRNSCRDSSSGGTSHSISSSGRRCSTVAHVQTLEVVGSSCLPDAVWAVVVADVQQRLWNLRAVHFLSECRDADRSTLIRGLSSRLEAVHIRNASTSSSSSSLSAVPDCYRRTFRALGDCRRLREVHIVGGPRITDAEAKVLVSRVVVRLERFALREAAFASIESWRALWECAEHDSVAAITCDSYGAHTDWQQQQQYVQWNAALQSLRLSLLDHIALTERLQPNQNSALGLLPRTQPPQHPPPQQRLDDRVHTVEATITVLRDWYRSTHPPMSTKYDDVQLSPMTAAAGSKNSIAESPPRC